MIKLKRSSFNGAHVDDKKDATSQKKIEILPINAGDKHTIPLTQHIGAPAKPLVKKGQPVRAGELIAEAQGFISANIHSPVDGVVLSLSKEPYPSSGMVDSIVIEASETQEDPLTIEKGNSLSEMAKNAGIVGMGGAMFPTHVKLSPKTKIDTLIINGSECEPYLTCDHRLMLERTKDLINGAILIKDELKLSQIFFALEANKENAAIAIDYLLNVEPIQKALNNTKAKVVLLPTFYPQGGERQLIQMICNLEVPQGRLPSDIGVLVQNVSTVLALNDAYEKGLPLIKRVVTVTKDVTSPKNLLAPLGTSISKMIGFCGGSIHPNIEKIVLGGPMTGFAAQSAEIPVYKGMNGIIVYSQDPNQKQAVPKTNPCIRCGRCEMACPAGLSPWMLENFYNREMYKELSEWKLLSCIECSACVYVCPSGRPLKTVFKLAKKRCSP